MNYVKISTDNTPHKLAWLVSFGDLLTLLLTFFIGGIAYNANKEINLTKNLTGNATMSGIPLAKALYEDELGVIKVGFLDDIELQIPTLIKFDQILPDNLFQVESIIIEVCSLYAEDIGSDVKNKIIKVFSIIQQNQPSVLALLKARLNLNHNCKKNWNKRHPQAVVKISSYRYGGRTIRTEGKNSTSYN